MLKPPLKTKRKRANKPPKKKTWNKKYCKTNNIVYFKYLQFNWNDE